MRKILSVFYFCLLVLPGFAQDRQVSGVVTSGEDNSPLPGVSVAVKGTTNGVITGADGSYRVNAPGGATLVFSFIGFTPEEVVLGNQTTVNVQLKLSPTQLNEIVVTGYDSQQKRNITGAVSTVTIKNFKDLPVASVDQALQGQAPGVQVTQSSGTPGGGIMVRIRGNTSISASNRPLYIIDGIPVETGTLSGREFGGQNDNALSTINPNDVESIQVLKDASTKAIYGSRGANGVVLITTKRGRANARTQFSLDVQRGMIDITKKPELLNSTQLLELQREAVTNAGRNPDEEGLIPGVTDAVNTNWLDEVLRTGIYQQYQLNMSGGDQRTSFYSSVSYRDEEGVQLNNRFERYAGTFTIDHKATSKLTIGSNILLSRTKNFRVKGDNFLDGVYSGALKSLPYDAPYDEQGNLIGPSSPNYPGFPNFNPVAQALLPRFEAYTLKILGGVYAEYAFRNNLKFRTKFSTDYTDTDENQFESSQTAIGGYLENVGKQGYGVYITNTTATIINTNTLSYNTSLEGKHNISALLGTEVLQTTVRGSSVQGRLFPSDDFTYITSAGIVDQGSSSLVQNGLVSLFAKADYDYQEKYLVNLTARTDGSSRFGPGRRYAFFPSISGAWRISAEPFMERFDFINDLKVRASFGYSGNQGIGDFQFLGTFAAVSYSGTSGTAPAGLGNASLQWERTREADLGVDITLFNNRVTATADVYSNRTDKLLFAQPVPLTTGFETVQGNIGNISNRGVELGLRLVNTDGAFRWTTDFNISRNINRVESLADTTPLFRGYQANGVSNTNVVKVGEPLGSFWGLKFLGVDPATGNALYEDRNGDGQITPDDATVIGNAQPKFIGGMTNRITYRNFDLSFFFQWSYGNKLLNFTNTTLLDAGQDLKSNQVVAALRRWRKEGDITDVPRYEADNTYNNYLSNRFLEDGSYLRLKNVTLGYNFSKNLLSRYKLSTARLYVSATNLLTFTEYTGNDPEVSTLDGSTTAQGIDYFTLPQVRTLMVGLSVGF